MFATSSALDVWLGSESTPILPKKTQTGIQLGNLASNLQHVYSWR